MNNRVISLITDFGTKDGYAGVMKGVILNINPQAILVDISHDVSPQDTSEAAFVLKNSYAYFPKDSIHLVVVDPGVGGKRKAILVDAGEHLFVGPDNGVFTHIYDCEKVDKVIELTNERYFLPNRSRTFHGRDIFAPVVAYLSMGLSPNTFGDECNDLITIENPQPVLEGGVIRGIVFHIDSFGNIITNIPEVLFRQSVGEGRYSIIAGEETIKAVKDSYSEVDDGEVLAIFGSSGYLEIAVRNQNGQERLRLNKGDEIRIIY